MFDKGIFGGMFDFNGDGKLDGFERAADHMAFMNMVSESKKRKLKVVEHLLVHQITMKKMNWSTN